MQLLIFRHADAGDPSAWEDTGKLDAERPLSDKGRRQASRAAQAIPRLVAKVDLVTSSPYVRAVQTADLVFGPFATKGAIKITDSLVPDAEPEVFVRWLATQRPREVVAAVGHEPHLSTLATWLIAGLDESRLRLKKGRCLPHRVRTATSQERRHPTVVARSKAVTGRFAWLKLKLAARRWRCREPRLS